ATSDVVTTFGEYVQAGVTLEVKPYIRHAGHVRVEVSQEISDFSEVSGQAAGDLPPARTVRQLKAVVDVPDDRIVVIGGVQTLRDSGTTDRVPLLARIPIVGELFKSRDSSNNANTIYLFLAPHILRDEGFGDLGSETEMRVNELIKANESAVPGLGRYKMGPIEVLPPEPLE
ncbi:MAG: hypothetical protein JW990_10860, partial [Thermoleophilia bacterium]|nr:hypothetical protein [Thermoleophilia bacterium]